MNLLDLVVKIICDDQASGQVSGIGSKITGVLGTAARVGGAAVAALGTATIALGKTALDSYANYEQLVGGIDTLFKDSSGKMQQYAADAYKTAGVSANRYMEISTSFAASLINSLGGDTAAAADMANMAIMDMSDNANKMGTSLEVVQEAYQSLARGNYEMLDSLKLGYGGTKTELERLLSDAEQIAASQGMVRDYSVDSYSDIVEAIHLVQDEMGITGTTALEASTTIEGSINTAKAAWDNWLAGLGNEDADMGALTDQLVQSVVTAGENIIPRFGMIMSNLVTTVTTYAPQVGEAIMSGISQLDFTSIGQTASDLILTLVDGIVQNLPILASAALQIVMALGQGLIANGPQILASLGQLLLQLVNFIIQNVPNILTAAVQFFGMLIQGIAQNAPMIITTFVSLLGQLIAQVISWAAQMLGQAISAGVQFLGGLMGSLAPLPGRLVSFFGGIISSVVSWVSQMASNAISAGSQFLTNVVNYIARLPGQIAGFLSGVIGNVARWVGQMASNASRAASQFANNLISGLQSIPGRVVSIGRQIINGMVDGVLGAAGSLIDAVGGVVNDAIGWAKNLLGIASPSKVFREMFGYVMEGAELGVDDNQDLPARALGRAIDEMESVPAPVLTGPVAATAGAYGGTVYNVYLDGSLVRVDSRIGQKLEAFVDEVAAATRMGRR